MMEPLESRRLLAAVPAAVSPLDQPGAWLLPSGAVALPATTPQAATTAAAPRGGTSAPIQSNPAPTGARFGAASTNSASPPVLAVSSSPIYSGTELYQQQGWIRFDLDYTLSGSYTPPAGGTSFSYTLPADEPNLATPTDDYTGPLLALSGTIPSNASTLYLPFTPAKDYLVEGTEKVKVVLQPGAGYTINSGASTTSLDLIDNPYTITVGEKTLAVGETDKIPLSLRDSAGNPGAGVTLDVVKVNTSIILPQEMSVVTDASGNALLDVLGVGAGISRLVMEANATLTGSGDQTVQHASLNITSDPSGFSGQQKTARVKVTNKAGAGLPNVRVEVTSSDPGTASVPSNDPAHPIFTGPDGTVDVPVTLGTPTAAGAPATLTVTTPADLGATPGTALVTVKPVFLRTTKTLTLSATGAGGVTSAGIIATVTDAAVNGNPVPNVFLNAKVNRNPGDAQLAVDPTGPNATSITNQAGEFRFTATASDRAVAGGSNLLNIVVGVQNTPNVRSTQVTVIP